MPTYDYFCQACEQQSEISHRMSDPNATVCPRCGASALVKQMSAPAFRLKGGGWYETDFKSDGKRNLAEASDSGSSKNVDTKPVDAKPAAESKPAPAPTPSATT